MHEIESALARYVARKGSSTSTRMRPPRALRWTPSTWKRQLFSRAISLLGESGRADEAKARADRFLSRYGTSPQAARIRALHERMRE